VYYVEGVYRLLLGYMFVARHLFYLFEAKLIRIAKKETQLLLFGSVSTGSAECDKNYATIVVENIFKYIIAISGTINLICYASK